MKRVWNFITRYSWVALQVFVFVFLTSFSPIYFRDAARAKESGDTFKYRLNIIGAWAYLGLPVCLVVSFVDLQRRRRKQNREWIAELEQINAKLMSGYNAMISEARDAHADSETIAKLVSNREKCAEAHRRSIEKIREA